MNLNALSNYLISQNLPDYRFRQIKKNYFSAKYQNFEQMTDLPKLLRQDLDSKFPLYSYTLDRLVKSNKTQKVRLKLVDGSLIETVLMDYEKWLTVCLSSQVGCGLGCKFCATGKMGLKRQLTSEEIVDQILFWNHQIYPKTISRVVFMGMGEPFLNWENLLESFQIINSKDTLNLGSRKISISTSGIVPKIKEFADYNQQINLAISLHSANQETRQTIMPIAKKYPLNELLKASLYYVNKTNRQLFFEYLLIDKVNDTPNQISSLTNFLKKSPLFYLNLIPLNKVDGGLIPSNRLAQIKKQLDMSHINYSVRQSFGQDINSACGQLIIKK
jgi:23S rRNA (adenine2503-C2)-methyltransferase